MPDNQPIQELLANFIAIGPDTVVRRARLKPYGLCNVLHESCVWWVCFVSDQGGCVLFFFSYNIRSSSSGVRGYPTVIVQVSQTWIGCPRSPTHYDWSRARPGWTTQEP